ncbi:unnamed protein product, partial [Scytosiphon promiscuus]
MAGVGPSPFQQQPQQQPLFFQQQSAPSSVGVGVGTIPAQTTSMAPSSMGPYPRPIFGTAGLGNQGGVAPSSNTEWPSLQAAVASVVPGVAVSGGLRTIPSPATVQGTASGGVWQQQGPQQVQPFVQQQQLLQQQRQQQQQQQQQMVAAQMQMQPFPGQQVVQMQPFPQQHHHQGQQQLVQQQQVQHQQLQQQQQQQQHQHQQLGHMQTMPMMTSPGPPVFNQFLGGAAFQQAGLAQDPLHNQYQQQLQ